MSTSLPKKDKLISISETAKVLGVSIDTVRRWDRKGILHPERINGKGRYFSIDELEKVKFAKPLSISEASKQLGISATTLRRLEVRGLIKPDRNEAGERVYNKESLEKFLNGEYFLRQKKIEEKILRPQEPEEEPPTHKVLASLQTETRLDVSKLLNFRNAFYVGGALLLVTFVLLVTFITVSFLTNPVKTAQFFGYRQNNNVLGASYPQKVQVKGQVLGKVLKPLADLSLDVISQIDKKTYERIVPKKAILDINDVLGINEKGSLAVKYNFEFPDSSYLQIPDSGLVKNLNVEYLQGKVPGEKAGDLVIWGSGSTIEGLTIQAYDTIQEEGSSLTQRNILNFAGAAFTATDDSSNARINISANSGLNNIAGLSLTDGNFIVGDGTSWVAESGSTARASLGLGGMATQEASSVSITGGTITTITTLTTSGNVGIGGSLTVSSGLSLPNSSISNSNLANSSLTVTAGSGLSGGGLVSLGGSTGISLDLTNPNTWTGIQTFNQGLKLPNGIVTPSGNLGIGTSAGVDYNLKVLGTGYFSGNVGIGSSLTTTGLGVFSGGLQVSGSANLGNVSGTTLAITGNISTSSVFLASNGSASAPSISFTNDTDTGLWRVNTNLVALTANGSGSLQTGTSINGLSVNSGGNVGIGTTSPAYSLDVAGTVRVKGTVLSDSTTGDEMYRYNQIPLWHWWNAPAVVKTSAQVGTVGNYGTWDGTNFWIGDFGAHTVYKLDQSAAVKNSYTFPHYDPLDVDISPLELTWDGSNIWVGSGDNYGLLYKLDPTTGTKTLMTITNPTPLGTGGVQGVMFDGSKIYAGVAQNGGGAGSGQVQRIDPTTGTIEAYATGQTNVNGLTLIDIAESGGRVRYIWAACAGFVSKIRTSDMTEVGRLTLASSVGYRVTTDGTYIYVATFDSPGKIFKIRAKDLVLVDTWTSGNTLNTIAFDGRYIWVAGDDNNTTIHDRDTGNIVYTLTNAGKNGLVFDGSYMWATNSSFKVVKMSIGDMMGNLQIANSLSLENIGVGTSTSNTPVFFNANGISYLNGGNVGIGTTSPNQALQVVGNVGIGGSASVASYLSVGSLYSAGAVCLGTDCRTTWPAGGGESTTASNGLYLSGSDVRLGGSLTQATGIDINGQSFGLLGNVGIGTSANSASRLSVMGGNVGIGTTNPSQLFQVNINSSNPVVITSTGNVGIGTTSPGGKLEIVGGLLVLPNGDFGSSAGFRFRNTSGILDGGLYEANNNKFYFQFGSGDAMVYKNYAGTGIAQFDNAGNIYLAAGGGLKPYDKDSTTALQIRTYSGNTLMVNFDTSNKRVGIGSTAAPDRQLQINSDIDITSTNASLLGVAGTQLSITGSSTSTSPKKLVLGLDTTDNYGVIQAGHTDGTNYNLILNPAGGNIGIGTVSPLAQLDLRNTNTSTGLHMYVGSSAGQFSILDNGNVGIGTTAPLSTLDVRGPIENGLVAWWPMDEGTGTTISDQSINSNTGTLGNGTAEYRPIWATGKFSNALDYDGTDDYVEVPNSASIELLHNPLTVEAWIYRRTNSQDWEGIVVKGKATDPWDSYSLFSLANGYIRARVGNYTVNVDTTSAMTNNTWHHVVLRNDGTNFAIYIDGIKASADATTGTVSTTGQVLWIGRASSAGEFFDGMIDEVRVYNRALSAREISEHYRQEAPSLAQGGTVSGNLYMLNGNVGIGATTSSNKLDVWGTSRFTGNLTNDTLAGVGNRAVYSDANGQLTNSSSDIRLKTNIESIPNSLDVLSALGQLRGVYFNWDQDVAQAQHFGSQRELGMIAQEVEAVLPELVGENANGYKSLNYAQMAGFLVEVGKAQQKQIDDLLSRIEFNQADKIEVNQIEGREATDGAKLTDLATQIASGSASSLQADSAQTINIEGLEIEGDLLYVKKDTIFDKLVHILESLTTRNLIVTDWARFLAEVLFKGDVTFEGRTTFNKDSAGGALIKKDTDSVEVVFEKEYAQTPLVTISITLDEQVSDADKALLSPQELIIKLDAQNKLEQDVLNGDLIYIVIRRNTKGFTIKLNKSAPADVKFSWQALAVKDARLSESSGSAVLSAVVDSSPLATPSPTPSPSPSPSPSPPKTITINETELGYLRVRDGPATSFDEIEQVEIGATFEVFEESPSTSSGSSSWYQIEYEDGKYGWVSSSYVTLL